MIKWLTGPYTTVKHETESVLEQLVDWSSGRLLRHREVIEPVM